MPNTIPMPFVV